MLKHRLYKTPTVYIKQVYCLFLQEVFKLTLILLEPKVISLCHHYRARRAVWPSFSFHLDVLKFIMDSSKNGRRIIPFKEIQPVKVNNSCWGSIFVSVYKNHLPFLELSIIIFRDIKMPTWSLANSIKPGQTAWMCRLAWLYIY